jgi:long-chain acyl-CoA synthetase
VIPKGTFRTVPELWARRVAATPSALAFRYRQGEQWTGCTWREADEHVRRIAAGLVARGLQKGDRVAILCGTRVEWVWSDFGTLSAGLATSTIYPSSTSEECRYILSDAGCAAVFVEDRGQLDKIRPFRGELPALRHVFVIDPEGTEPADATPLARLEDEGAAWLEAHPEGPRADVRPDDLATLIYTSGTTGPPKGVILTHDNWVFQAEALGETVAPHVRDDDVQYLFLPLAHAYGKVVELVAVALGVPTAIDGDTDRILDGLKAVRPTMMPAVPRVFEKIYNRIVTRARDAGERRYAIFRWAVRVGDEVVRRRMAGQRVGIGLALRFRVADRLVFSKLRDALGGRIRAFVSGGAPLSPDIARFFEAAGMTILEGYGLTETSAGASSNRRDDFAFGTVGRPLPGSEMAIAPDGEVLVRGRNVMKGYWNRPEATADAIDREGWFHTGDLGAFDEHGRLAITGRKKDLIVTAGGKNVAPTDPENRVKASCPLVAEIVTVGDARPYCAALVWLDPEAIAAWAAERGRDGALAARAGDPELVAAVEAAVEDVNRGLPSYATIKKVTVLDHAISPESGLLTPSLKVKRSLVTARYAQAIEAMYPDTVVTL